MKELSLLPELAGSKGTVAGVILAAGESSRMGRDKALLPLGAQTFVGHLAEALRGDTEPLVIVLGHNAGGIAAQLSPALQERILLNPDYKLGQLSSLKVAVRALLREKVSGAVMCLVDTPAINKKVVRSLLEQFQQSGSPIVIPTCGGRRGHPVLFASELFPELLDAPLDQGARVVVQRHSNEIAFVETDEEGILLDVDRPEDYQALLARWPTLNSQPEGLLGEPS